MHKNHNMNNITVLIRQLFTSSKIVTRVTLLSYISLLSILHSGWPGYKDRNTEKIAQNNTQRNTKTKLSQIYEMQGFFFVFIWNTNNLKHQKYEKSVKKPAKSGVSIRRLATLFRVSKNSFIKFSKFSLRIGRYLNNLVAF